MKKTKKPFFKKIWVWLIVAILFCVNLIFAFILSDKYSNVFTAISGWISGIATAVLGIIAIAQNERYEKDNKEFLEEQNRIQQQIVLENKRQNEFNKRQSAYKTLNQYYNNISKELLSFFSNNLACEIKREVCGLHEKIENSKELNSVNYFGSYVEDNRRKLTTLSFDIRIFLFSFRYRNQLINKLYEMSEMYLRIYQKYATVNSDWVFIKENLLEDIDGFQQLEYETFELVLKYLAEIEIVLKYYYDSSNTNQECEEFTKVLIQKRDKDEAELEKYYADLKDKQEESNNG